MSGGVSSPAPPGTLAFYYELVLAMDLTALKSIASNFLEYASPARTEFTISGTVRHGQRTVLSQNIRYSDYGYGSGYTFSIIANISDFGTVPADDTEITVGGVIYRILSTEQDTAGILITLHIGDRTA
jgi:hypothetical protein